MLAFDEPNRNLIRFYYVNMMIPHVSASLMKTPSIVGRDILDRWRINYDPGRKSLKFTVRSADHTVSYQISRILTHLMAANRCAGQARREARCLRIGRGSQRIRRADVPHRRPRPKARPPRCDPLVVYAHHGAGRALRADFGTR